MGASKVQSEAMALRDHQDPEVDGDGKLESAGRIVGGGDNKAFLESFWNLASVDGRKRSGAGAAIIEYLKASQARFEGNESIKSQERVILASPDVQYALKRLLRGLCSSRESARHGFSAALSVLLSTFRFISLRETLKSLLEITETTGGMKNSEERELVFGRIFGCMAVYRSGRLELQKKATKEEKEDVRGAILAAIDTLVKLFPHKKFLRELCSNAIAAFLLSSPSDLAIEEIIPRIGSLMDGKSIKELNPEQLLLVLAVERYMRTQELQRKDLVVQGKLLKIFAKKLSKTGKLSKLSNPLKQSSGNYPKVHSVWKYLMAEIFQCDLELTRTSLQGAPDVALVREFWSVCVVDTLIVGGTHEKKALSFKLCSMIFPLVTEPLLVQSLLSPAFLRCVVNNASKKGTYLHEPAKEMLNGLLKTAKEDERVKVATMIALLSNGGHNFDKRTGLPIVSSLVQEMGQEGLAEYISFLIRCIFLPEVEKDLLEDDEDEGMIRRDRAEEAEGSLKLVDGKRMWAADALSASVKNAKLPWTEDMLKRVVGLFFLFSLFNDQRDVPKNVKTKKKKSKRPFQEEGEDPFLLISGGLQAEPGFSPAFLSSCEQRFFSLVSDLSVVKVVGQDGEKVMEKGAKTQDRSKTSTKWLDYCLSLWSSLEGKGVQPKKALNDEQLALRERVQGTIDTLRASGLRQTAEVHEKASKKRKQGKSTAPDAGASFFSTAQLDAFQILLLHLTLQLLSSSRAEEAASSLEDLLSYLSKDRKEEKAKIHSEGESSSIAVLTDLLIGLLSQSNHAVRDVIKEVFRAVVTEVDEDALKAILSVCCKQGGDEPLLDVEEDEDDDFSPIDPSELTQDREDESDEDDELVDDDEDTPRKAKESLSEEDQEDEVMVDFHQALMDEDDEERMDREDSAIAALLKAQQEKQKRKRQAKSIADQTLHFRLRVLDLLDIFLMKRPDSLLIPTLVIPAAVKSMRTGQKAPGKGKGGGEGAKQEKSALFNRLRSILLQRIAKGKDVPRSRLGDEETTKIVEAMEIVVTALLKASTRDVIAPFSSALLYLMRVLMVNLPPSSLPKDKLRDIYDRAADSFFRDKKSRLTPQFFEDFMTKFPQVAWQILPLTLVRGSFPYSKESGGKPEDARRKGSRSLFARAEAFRLSTIFFKRYSLTNSSEDLRVLREAEESFRTAIQEVAGAGDASNTPLGKSKRLREVLMLGQTIMPLIRARKLNLSLDIYHDLLPKIQQSTQSGPVKGSCIQILKQLDYKFPESSSSTTHGKGDKQSLKAKLKPLQKQSGQNTDSSKKSKALEKDEGEEKTGKTGTGSVAVGSLSIKTKASGKQEGMNALTGRSKKTKNMDQEGTTQRLETSFAKNGSPPKRSQQGNVADVKKSTKKKMQVGSDKKKAKA